MELFQPASGSPSVAAETPAKEERKLPPALPSFTTLLPAEGSTSSTGSSASDQPEITVPTLVPGMITPGSVQESPCGSLKDASRLKASADTSHDSHLEASLSSDLKGPTLKNSTLSEVKDHCVPSDARRPSMLSATCLSVSGGDSSLASLCRLTLSASSTWSNVDISVFSAIEVGFADLPDAVWDGVTSPGRAMQPRHASCLDQEITESCKIR